MGASRWFDMFLDRLRLLACCITVAHGYGEGNVAAAGAHAGFWTHALEFDPSSDVNSCAVLHHDAVELLMVGRGDLHSCLDLQPSRLRCCEVLDEDVERGQTTCRRAHQPSR